MSIIAYLGELCTKQLLKVPKYFYFFIFLSLKIEIYPRKVEKVQTTPLLLETGEYYASNWSNMVILFCQISIIFKILSGIFKRFISTAFINIFFQCYFCTVRCCH